MSSITLTAAATAGLMSLGGMVSPEGFPIRVDAGRMLMKATPGIEGGQRVVYFQASTETRDFQGERILAKALIKSIPYFLRHGRIDLDHATAEDPKTHLPLGEIRRTKLQNPYAFEIGRPADARAEGEGVMVKAAIYSAKTPGNQWTQAADLFWDSLQTNPPVPWYPSVQGVVINEAGVVDEGLPTQEIHGLLWQTVGLSRNPVSPDIPAITTVPLRVFCKAMGSVKGMSDLMASFRGILPPLDPSPSTGELSEDQAKTVLEGLADAPKHSTPAQILQSMESRGVPQEHALAVMIALLNTPT